VKSNFSRRLTDESTAAFVTVKRTDFEPDIITSHYATSRKIAGSNPDEVTGFFQLN
jgi:hypothetical protein